MVKNFINYIEQKIDKDIFEGSIGTAMAISFPYMDFLTKSFQLIGAAGGLILLYLAIRHKILEIKKLKIKKTTKNGNTRQQS